MALVHSTGMFLSELQESIHHLSNHIISLLPPSSSPSSEEFETTTHQCDRCAITNKQLTKICSTIQCPSMRVCSRCLFQLFEANGYHNTCPICHQYLKFEKYQEACDSPVSIPLNEVKSTLESLIDQICCDDESSYPSNPPHERTFENVLNEWESCFNLSCDCGETHYLYPSESHGSIISGLDFQSLMKMVKRVCGPSEERQFLFLQILQKFISGEKSSSEFIENCESYFLTHSEYSKRSHMKYCAKNGLANNVRSYSLILSFLSFIDRGMRYRVAYSLLERYPKITLRCGRYYCFRCKLFSQERSLHPCVATSSSILQSAITTTSVSETDLPPVPGPPPQAIRDIFADILRSFSPPQCSPLPLKQCAFTCCLCLEEHEALSFFDGCSKPQCTSESNLKPVCKECMLSYVKNRIDSSPYSLSQIKCLNCSSRISTAHWSAALKSDTNKIHNDRLSTVIQKYETNYSQMRRSRCGSCHNTYTPFAVLAPVPHSSVNPNLTDSFLLERMCKFLTCLPSTVDVTTLVDPSLPLSNLKTSRKNRNSAPVALKSSRSNLSKVPANRRLSTSTSTSVQEHAYPSTRMVLHLAKTVRSFVYDEITPDEFIEQLNHHLLGSNLGPDDIQRLRTQVSDDKIHHGSLFVALFVALQDIERQSCAINALLKRYPHFRTKCCNAPFCYICKISSFHSGKTCAEWMRNERGDGLLMIKYCPSCNVPTVRSEGCSSITCLCGRHWSW